MQIGVIGLGRMGGKITPAIEEAVPADVSAMRKGFGAHVEPKDHKVKPS